VAVDAFEIRQAHAADANAMALVHRLARRGALPDLPDSHTPEEDLAFFCDRVLRDCEVWVACLDKAVVGFCALKEQWIEHLYVTPTHQRRGLGTRFLHLAMQRRPALQLWTFQRNRPACDFYEKHGFIARDCTDGLGNEEKEPDVLYAWSSAQARTPLRQSLKAT
jgi:putative acetyltransferase